MRILWLAACGDGGVTASTDAAVTYTLTSGTYQLTTFSVTGDCKTDDIISPAAEFVGKVMPVELVTSASGVAVHVCNFSGAVPECSGLGDAFDFSFAREGDALIGGPPRWTIPGCGCTDFESSAVISGTITADDMASLTWTLEIDGPEPSCTCSGYRVCSGVIEQRLSR